jgi:hypothetical protein
MQTDKNNWSRYGARIRAAAKVQVDMSAVAGNPDKICSG